MNNDAPEPTAPRNIKPSGGPGWLRERRSQIKSMSDPGSDIRVQATGALYLVFFYFCPTSRETVKSRSAGRPTPSHTGVSEDAVWRGVRLPRLPRPVVAEETLKQDLRHCQSFLADPPRGSCSRFDEFQRRATHRRWNPKISWEGATAAEATAEHDLANRSFGVDLTWRTWRVTWPTSCPRQRSSCQT